jgi:hypothetical protein
MNGSDTTALHSLVLPLMGAPVTVVASIVYILLVNKIENLSLPLSSSEIKCFMMYGSLSSSGSLLFCSSAAQDCPCKC